MKRKTKILTELEKVRILAEANMKLAGVPALHDTLETLQNQEKYEELAIMNDVYKKANQVDAVVSQAASQAMPEPNDLGAHNCDNCRYWKFCKKEIRYFNEEGHCIDAKLEYCSKFASQL